MLHSFTTIRTTKTKHLQIQQRVTYPGCAPELKHQTPKSFLSRKQQQNENVYLYVTQLRLLAKKAFPEVNQDVAETYIADQFIDGIRIPEIHIKLKVARTSLNNFNEIVELASRYEKVLDLNTNKEQSHETLVTNVSTVHIKQTIQTSERHLQKLTLCHQKTNFDSQAFVKSTIQTLNFYLTQESKELLIRRICSNLSDFTKNSLRLTSQLVDRGYDNKVFNMVFKLEREELIDYKLKPPKK
ncbi:unnamed protein product, partial [Brachionus calyciflorus]